ncbi:hypothetical protein E2C01_092569 [Portunus trituberculatus]|uniref:Uncharacterized protein n=1 Tax=Portunus trituberculatus TaxID=210409 RepID=A0A5B7JY37_PORTR|nr:hypothetical protein [Portunus trituberculatus]
MEGSIQNASDNLDSLYCGRAQYGPKPSWQTGMQGSGVRSERGGRDESSNTSVGIKEARTRIAGSSCGD